MKQIWKSILLTGICVHLPAFAFEPFVVQKIQISGLERISEATVLNYLPVQTGQTVQESQSPQIIRALFNTGFFDDVGLERSGDALVVTVKERPAIGKIEVSGNKDIKTEDLLESLKSAGLAEGHTFDKAMLERVRNELERMYFSHGKYAVEIDAKVTEQPRNRVAIAIHIVEKDAARIKEINIIGNQAFSSEKLLKQFSLSPSNLLSWFSKNDQYAKQKLGADLETLRTFYLDRGYLNFQIVSTQVSISPDKRDIYVTINIDEGSPYTIRDFDVGGDLLLSRDILMPLITLKKGDTFSRTKVGQIIKVLTDRFGQEGYAFAQVNPVPELDEANKTVRVVFFIEPGSRVYVRRVLFEGNTKTRDEVLRREMTQLEGAPVSTTKVEESRTRLNRTGYFSEVEVETRPVPGVPDQVDVIYTVKEASAGQLSGGIGYSDVDGVLFNASVSNRNVLGTGNSVEFNFNQSKAFTTYNLSYNNPYYTMDGISRGFNAFFSKTDLSRTTNVSNYTTDAYGTNVNYGIPINATDRVSFGIGVQETRLHTSVEYAPEEIKNFVRKEGEVSAELSLALGWTRNTLDRFLFPENGYRHAISLNFTAPGSDLQYYKLTESSQWYWPIGKGFIGTLNTNFGFGGGYDRTDALPFYQNFYAGGSRLVRGYQESSLGPRDTNGNPFGGNFLAAASVGLVLPNFIAPESRSVRMTLFVDAGQVYDFKYRTRTLADGRTINRNPDGLRYTTGVSLTWMSPLAPLVFSLATPLNEHRDDKTQVFSFSFGTFF
ncbi:MAG: outer membrane protein assembly factor BamA [Gammaproteobacteria bacterium]